MTPRPLLSTAVSATLLLGCAYDLPRVEGTASCTVGPCQVAVTVIRNDATGGCIVSEAEPGTLLIPGRNPSDPPNSINIVWNFAMGSTGYRFPDYPPPGDTVKGVEFKIPNQVFVQCGAIGANGSQFQCVNQRDKGTYDYTINAIRIADGVACEPLDPSVVNQ